MNCILSIDKSNLSSRTNRTPTDFQDLSALIICLLRIKFRLSVGETCGLPRANAVRPYRVLGKYFVISPLRTSPIVCSPLRKAPLCKFTPRGAFVRRGEFRSLRRATKAPRLGLRSLFEKSNAKTFKHFFCVAEPF